MMLQEDSVHVIAAKWGLTLKSVGSGQHGYRNEIWPIVSVDSQELILILYKAEQGILSRIKRTNQLGSQLNNLGLPIRHPFDDKILRIKTLHSDRFISLYNALPGDTIPWEAYTMVHLKLLGWVMGVMHHTLKKTDVTLPYAADEHRNILKRLVTYFSMPHVSQAILVKLQLVVLFDANEFYNILDVCDQLPQQALHMDFVRGNVLFAPANYGSQFKLERYSLSGILDLEKAAIGPTVMDVARTLAFLLVDCKYKPELKVRKYFLESGYNKRGNHNLAQDATFEMLVNLFLLYDFYKFLRHNPYETLFLNEHYIRTKLLLLKRGLLQASDGRI